MLSPLHPHLKQSKQNGKSLLNLVRYPWVGLVYNLMLRFTTKDGELEKKELKLLVATPRDQKGSIEKAYKGHAVKPIEEMSL